MFEARSSAFGVLFASYCAVACSSSPAASPGESGGASGKATSNGGATAGSAGVTSAPQGGTVGAAGGNVGAAAGTTTPSGGGAASIGGATGTAGAHPGGTTGAGGSASGGATSGTGGTPIGAGGSTGTSTCTPPAATACTSPQVRITEIDVGAPVVVNEDDAALKMLSISPIPSGGSRVAWMSNDANVHVTDLGCDDHVVDSFAIPGHDYGDVYADDKGGVLLVSRDAQGGGTLNCGEPTNLCGTPPSPAIPCFDMYMVRFDGKTETWATKLTTASAMLPPYSTGPMGPQTYFIWWYAHHGAHRLRRHELRRLLRRRDERLADVHDAAATPRSTSIKATRCAWSAPPAACSRGTTASTGGAATAASRRSVGRDCRITSR